MVYLVSLTLPWHCIFMQVGPKHEFVLFTIRCFKCTTTLGMPRFFGKQIDIPGVSKNRSLSGFSWPKGTLSPLSLGRDQAGSEYRSSKLTVPYLASPGGQRQGQACPTGTWLLVNVGKREFPAWSCYKLGGTVVFSLSLLETAPPSAEPDAPPSTVQLQSPDI